MPAPDSAMTSRLVIPAKAGIQFFDRVAKSEELDSGLRRSDEVVRAV
jgi:hypothetical protein